MKPAIYNYQGSNITFQRGDSVMVNATEMAKLFGKRPVDWLKYQQAKDFISALSEVRKVTSADLVKVRKGGDGIQGTWLHEDVALEFARWLSPAFAIWCNDRIKELLQTGVTTTANDDEAILHAMQVLQKRVEENRVKVETLEAENKLQAQQLIQASGKVNYVDNVLQSTSTYTFTQIAKECEMTSAQKLADILTQKGIIFRQSGQYMPTAKYSGKDYFKTRTHSYEKSTGEKGTNTILVITEKGRMLIHDLLKP